MPGSAREAALTVLERCRREGAWSTAALDSAIRKEELKRLDAALAARLSLGVLQNSAYLDHYIDIFCRRGLEPKLRDILRLGVYQLLFLDRIPIRAAVNETVALCRKAGLERASGLVNAVLRRIGEQRDELPVIPGEGTPSYLSLRYSHPQWLTESLIHEKGYAFTEAFFQANNEAQKLCIQVNTLKTTVSDYTRALTRCEIPFREVAGLPGCLLLEGGRVTELPGYEEGLFYVQDQAARSAVAIAEPRPGMQVLDVCAAPGGKSFSAALEMTGQGSILSCDIHEKKCALIRAGADRLGIGCLTTLPRDARKAEPAWEGRFDLVIADVPCSGFGVIGKRPEIRWKKETEIAALPLIQHDILWNVSHFVKPGGVLLYSTCTVLRAENEDQIGTFLEGHPDYQAEAFRLGDVCAENGMYTFWPQIDGTDGFFVAKLRRNA